jgi:hypothetical protein
MEGNTLLYYKVAGLTFGVSLNASVAVLTQKMDAYVPFACEAGASIFKLAVSSGTSKPIDVSQLGREVLNVDDEGQRMVVYLDDQECYTILMYLDDDQEGWCSLSLNKDMKEGSCLVYGNLATQLYGLNNSLMMMYAFVGAQHDTLLFHSSVVKQAGKGYMFLGKSGTGKSTHTGLWLKYIAGTELLNDDNPAVRIMSDGKPYVFGTPWSGKTPCYKNDSVEVGGIVRLWQAPENQIERLAPLRAYAALLPTISCMRWEKRISDATNRTLSAIITAVPVYSLRNRPEREAAKMSYEALTQQILEDGTDGK